MKWFVSYTARGSFFSEITEVHPFSYMQDVYGTWPGATLLYFCKLDKDDELELTEDGEMP